MDNSALIPTPGLKEKLDNFSAGLSEGNTINYKLGGLLSGTGIILGVFLAFKHHRGIWGYIGYGLAGSLLGAFAGNTIGMIVDGGKK